MKSIARLATVAALCYFAGQFGGYAKAQMQGLVSGHVAAVNTAVSAR